MAPSSCLESECTSAQEQQGHPHHQPETAWPEPTRCDRFLSGAVSRCLHSEKITQTGFGCKLPTRRCLLAVGRGLRQLRSMGLTRRAGVKVITTVMLMALGLGCSRPNSAEAPAPPPSPSQRQPSGHPQPKLPTITLWLGAKEIIAEQATTPKQIQTGMMFRKELGENEGMLFVFARPTQISFWMRNTLLPLSCAYIDPAGVILEIHDMKPLDETGIQASSDQVQYVLEMNQGWFERNQVGVGTTVRTPRGTLGETYFQRP